MRGYLDSNGESGHIYKGTPTLLLTTTGRRSGDPLTIPLTYGRAGDRYLVVASRGGSRRHPQWYKNLVANPAVEVQIKAERFAARARTATPEEKSALWETMLLVTPVYDEYQAKTDRPIPIVVIERCASDDGSALPKERLQAGVGG